MRVIGSKILTVLRFLLSFIYLFSFKFYQTNTNKRQHAQISIHFFCEYVWVLAYSSVPLYSDEAAHIVLFLLVTGIRRMRLPSKLFYLFKIQIKQKIPSRSSFNLFFCHFVSFCFLFWIRIVFPIIIAIICFKLIYRWLFPSFILICCSIFHSSGCEICLTS